MAPVFPEVRDDRVASGGFANARSQDRVGLNAPPCLPQSSDMVDIDA
jgi:hypothetical protein